MHHPRAADARRFGFMLKPFAFYQEWFYLATSMGGRHSGTVVPAASFQRCSDMVKRISHEDSMCGVARPLDAIGDGWSLLILRDAFDGARRFGEFQKSLGLAKNILAARLRHLVAHGILEPVAAPDGGAHLEYALTDKGRGVFPLLVALRQWGDEYFFEPGEPRAALIDKKSGRPVRKLELHAHDGKLLRPHDTMVRVPADGARRSRKKERA
jgi:DNA-binding HxlR family transcriptional regulator